MKETVSDELIALCVWKSRKLRPALEALHDVARRSYRGTYHRTPERPNGWPCNPSATVLRGWKDEELGGFLQLLDAIERAHAAGEVGRWKRHLPEHPIGLRLLSDDVFVAAKALEQYWVMADDNGVMPGMETEAEKTENPNNQELDKGEQQ